MTDRIGRDALAAIEIFIKELPSSGGQMRDRHTKCPQLDSKNFLKEKIYPVLDIIGIRMQKFELFFNHVRTALTEFKIRSIRFKFMKIIAPSSRRYRLLG